MNEEALQKTLDEERVTFYSRSKQRLWTKGETSGNTLEIVDLQ
jgi:phosphoribosyl-ATP pyrophosphohydrolase/phosphoribosyl-AMP cyclohydrolase